MEELSLSLKCLTRTIDLITSDWMTDISHMDTDLVGTSCL